MKTIVGIKYGLVAEKAWDESTRVVYRTRRNIYSITTDSDDEGDVLDTSGLPIIGSSWVAGTDTDILCRCIRLNPIEIGPGAWDVEAEFSTRGSPSEDEASEEESEVHPTDRTPKWRWYSRTIDLLQVKDAITGDPILNSVGEPFYATRPVRIAVLVITRFQTGFSPLIFQNYCNHTNETEFWGAEPGIALLTEVTDDPVVIDGEALREVSYVIEFNFSENDPTSPGPGWKHSFLNEATKYKEYVSVPGSPFHFEPFMALGTPTTGLIDTDGLPLPDGDPAIYLDFNQFPQADLNDLKLGPTVWS